MNRSRIRLIKQLKNTGHALGQIRMYFDQQVFSALLKGDDKLRLDLVASESKKLGAEIENLRVDQPIREADLAMTAAQTLEMFNSIKNFFTVEDLRNVPSSVPDKSLYDFKGLPQDFDGYGVYDLLTNIKELKAQVASLKEQGYVVANEVASMSGLKVIPDTQRAAIFHKIVLVHQSAPNVLLDEETFNAMLSESVAAHVFVDKKETVFIVLVPKVADAAMGSDQGNSNWKLEPFWINFLEKKRQARWNVRTDVEELLNDYQIREAVRSFIERYPQTGQWFLTNKRSGQATFFFLSVESTRQAALSFLASLDPEEVSGQVTKSGRHFLLSESDELSQFWYYVPAVYARLVRSENGLGFTNQQAGKALNYWMKHFNETWRIFVDEADTFNPDWNDYRTKSQQITNSVVDKIVDWVNANKSNIFDAAMQVTPGGIDFNANQMQMNVTQANKSHDQAMTTGLAIDPAVLKQLQSPDFKGFDFTIESITPAAIPPAVLQVQ